MKLSDKQTLLSYFKARDEKQLTVVCNITGMHFQIVAPTLPNIQGLVYSGLSPLASLRAAETFASYKYSEGHYDQEPQTLAGAILSLLHHYKLRHDKLSAVEANMILSQLQPYVLSKALNYIVSLTPHERKRVDGLSLAEGDPFTLKAWLVKCYDVLDISNYAIEQEVETKPNKKPLLIHSVTPETKQEAKELLAIIKTTTDIDSKLTSIISMSIAKNNLALISPELRSNIINKLNKLGTNEAYELAAIFSAAKSNASQQETIVSKLLDEPVSIFPTKIEPLTSKLSLKEIIALKREQEAKQAAKQQPLSFKEELLLAASELEADGRPKATAESLASPAYSSSSIAAILAEDSEEIDSEDALAYATSDSLEVEMEEAEIEELDFEKDFEKGE